MNVDVKAESANIVTIEAAKLTPLVRAHLANAFHGCAADADTACEKKIVSLYIKNIQALLKANTLDTLVKTNRAAIEAAVFVCHTALAAEMYVPPCSSAAKALLALVAKTVRDNTKAYMWAGIAPESAAVYPVIRYLTHAGFYDPQLTRETFSGRPLARDAVALILDRKNADTRHEETAAVAGIALELCGRYIAQTTACRMEVVFPIEVGARLQQYLLEPHQVAGQLVVVAYTLHRTADAYMPVALLGFPEKTRVVGQRTAVAPLNTLFEFHTHQNNLYGPATPIMPPTLENFAAKIFSRNYLHFVAAREGVYSVQLSTLLQQYVANMAADSQGTYGRCVMQTLPAVTKALERFYKFDLQTPAAALAEAFVRNINAVRVTDIIRPRGPNTDCKWPEPLYDFACFHVDFTPWDTLEIMNEMRVATVGAFAAGTPCPPSIGQELGALADSAVLGLSEYL